MPPVLAIRTALAMTIAALPLGALSAQSATALRNAAASITPADVAKRIGVIADD